MLLNVHLLGLHLTQITEVRVQAITPTPFWVQLHDWEDFMKHFGDFSCCGNLNRGHEVSSDYHCEKAARVTVKKPHTALPTWVNST